MANRIYAKENIGKNAVLLGAMQSNGFNKLTLVISQTNAAIQDFFVLAYAVKIPMVAIACDTASPGITAFNIAIGTAAEGGALLNDNSDVTYPPQVNTVAGKCLFQNAGNTAPQDQLVTLVNGVPQQFQTSVPDAIFPEATFLTLRVATGGAVNGTIKVVMVMVPVDTLANQPQQSFNWLSSLG